MLTDRFDNSLTTASQTARDAYVRGVDLLLSGNPGAEAAFQQAIAADDGFALAYAAWARQRQIAGDAAEAARVMALANARIGDISPREQGHLAVLARLIAGDGPGAHDAALRHLDDHPRDVLIAQPLTSVFGLIGFSGRAGREAEQLAFLTKLSRHYGDDWWFAGQFAFAQVEVGQLDRAAGTIDRAMAAYPRYAYGAHIRTHVHYECGDTAAGLAALAAWLADYPRDGVLHCHISWHIAIWHLRQGDVATAWRVYDADVRPGHAAGPAINVLTDAASFLHRATLAGHPPPAGYWREVSDFATEFFPAPGVAFADAHAALAHAVEGRADPLAKLIAEPTGPAAAVVAACAQAFAAFAQGEWHRAAALLAPIMASHERLGGSRAQRDLLEFTMVASLLRAGSADDARLTLTMRRPYQAASGPVAGL